MTFFIHNAKGEPIPKCNRPEREENLEDEIGKRKQENHPAGLEQKDRQGTIQPRSAPSSANRRSPVP
jgi:hypothetical protein